MTRHAAALVFFAAVFATGFALHRDFGVPWDEPIQRDYARIVSRYVVQGDDALFNHPDRVYGAAHELVLLAAERLSGARDGPEIFAVRHLVNVLAFGVGLVLLYRLGLIGFGSRIAALGTCAALVISPAIFGHAFYNSKDLPFLSAFIVSAWTLVRALQRPRTAATLLHAIASGWLIAIRIPGILVPALTVAGVAYCVLRSTGGRERRIRLAHLGVYLAATAICTWALWPTLWRDPLVSFWTALQTMSRFPWDQSVLYRGDLIPATSLPWHYTPVWIAITTPIAYLGAFLLGVPATVRRFLREWPEPTPHAGVFPLLVLCWAFVPVLSVIALGSVLYDGWRQLFFVYPALLLIAMQGAVAAVSAIRRGWNAWPVRIAAAAAAGLVAIDVAGVVRFMAQAHPHAHVYFSALAGGVPGARFRYELDYWGLSYRAGFEALLRRDGDMLIPVFVADAAATGNVQALPFAERQRLLIVDSTDHAKYFLGAYRLRRDEYPYDDVIHRVEVSGTPILTVARLQPDLAMTPLSVPDVTEVLERNETATRAAGDAALRASLERGLRAWLAHFVRNARSLSIEIAAAPDRLRRGQLDEVTLRVAHAEIGDFRSGKPGIPVTALDLTVRELVVDLGKLESGELELAHASEAVVEQVELDEAAVNDALRQRTDDLRRLRVTFDDGVIRAEWSGEPAVQGVIRLWSGADPWKPRSENLMFDVEEFRVAGWRVPGAGLLPLLGGISSPLIDPERVKARVTLGPVRIEGGKLRVGGR